MKKEQKFRHLEKVLKALANKRRLFILAFLKKEKEATVSLISREIKLSFKSTSRHLSILLSAEIVEKEQRSLEAYYSIATNLPVPEIIKIILSIG